MKSGKSFNPVNRGSDVHTTRLVLETTNTKQEVALRAVAPVDTLVVVAHTPAVGVVGIALRSTPPIAAVADIVEIAL